MARFSRLTPEEMRVKLLIHAQTFKSNVKQDDFDMACSCHGKKGETTTHVLPYDQCSVCARKHINDAWKLWNEFTYEDDNRDSIAGDLRAAVNHLKSDHRETALLARELATMIEENRDSEIGDQWKKLRTAVREHYYADHPDALERLNKLKAASAEQ